MKILRISNCWMIADCCIYCHWRFVFPFSVWIMYWLKYTWGILMVCFPCSCHVYQKQYVYCIRLTAGVLFYIWVEALMVRTLQPNFTAISGRLYGCRAQAIDGTGVWEVYIYIYIYIHIWRESTLQSGNANFPYLLICSWPLRIVFSHYKLSEMIVIIVD